MDVVFQREFGHYIINPTKKERQMQKVTEIELKWLFDHREFLPAQLKYRLRIRLGRMRNPDQIANATVLAQIDQIKECLAKGYPPLYPHRFDLGRWIGSSRMPISATTPVISFAAEGKIITADYSLVRAQDYPAVILGIQQINDDLFIERLDVHLERKLKLAWSHEYATVADDLRRKAIAALEYFQAL
jgi:hypothetical protein